MSRNKKRTCGHPDYYAGDPCPACVTEQLSAPTPRPCEGCEAKDRMLRELEWDKAGSCPLCVQTKHDGHARGCPLRAALSVTSEPRAEKRHTRFCVGRDEGRCTCGANAEPRPSDEKEESNG